MADVADQNFEELVVPLGNEDGECVGNEPVQNTNHPELQSQTEGHRQSAVDNRDTPGCTAQQDGLGQRPAYRNGKAIDVIARYH